MNTDTSITETKGLPVVVNVEGLCCSRGTH